MLFKLKVIGESFRKNIGIVQQDVYLFAGTVYDNILYGKPTAFRDEVIEVAKLAKNGIYASLDNR